MGLMGLYGGGSSRASGVFLRGAPISLPFLYTLCRRLFQFRKTCNGRASISPPLVGVGVFLGGVFLWGFFFGVGAGGCFGGWRCEVSSSPVFPPIF